MSHNGKAAWLNGMTEAQEREIAAALERVFRHFNEHAGPRDKDQRTQDFIFHMTDWHEDLVRLAKLYARPTEHDHSEWNEAVGSFLYHAVGHLVAAAKLNDTLLDPFGVVKNATPEPKAKMKKSAPR